MRLAVISTPDGSTPGGSPPDGRDGELATVLALFEAGLGRFHLRKPTWDEGRFARWLAEVPEAFHGRIVLHSHPRLAHRFAVGGVHFRDSGDAQLEMGAPPGLRTSRACHSAAGLLSALGTVDAVMVAPVFPSLSKPGHGPLSEAELARIAAVLTGDLAAGNRPRGETLVFALGGVTANRLPACRAMGFDGVALLGAVWDAPDPVTAFREIHAIANDLSPQRKTQ